MISNSWVIVIGVGVGAGGGTGVGATAHAAPARDAIITNETIRRCIKTPCTELARWGWGRFVLARTQPPQLLCQNHLSAGAI